MMMENENKIYTAPRILIRLAVRLVKKFYLLICQQERREITKQQKIYPERHRQVLDVKKIYVDVKALSWHPGPFKQ